jgi:signal transduction histidine kinase
LEPINKKWISASVTPPKNSAPANTKKNNSHNVRNFQSDFISATSHQLRTPLATFQSSIELLEYYMKEGNLIRQKETIVKIRKTLRYLTSTIENITTLYKNTISKQKLVLKEIDIRKFTNDLLEEIVISLGDKHLIYVNLESGVGKIISDEFILKQILINLIHNSVKFSPKGGQIKLIISNSDTYIEFLIKDEGIGIEKKDMIKIFNPFFRGKNALPIPGAGLGLAIVKKMTRILKAKIECTSKINIGTEFKLRIPAKGIK